MLTWGSAVQAQEADLPQPDPTQEQAQPEAQQVHGNEAHFDQLVQEGSAHFEAGRVKEALASFQAAYALKPDSNLLYNIAYLHEQQGELQPALDRYTTFLTAPGVDLENRKLAAERIKALREVLSVQQPAPASPEPVKVVAQAPQPAPQASPSAQAPMAQPKAQPQSSTLRTTSYILGGGGLLLLGTGAVTGVLANGAFSDMENASTLSQRRNHAEHVDNLALTTDLLLTSGLALTTTGLVMYLLDDSDEAAPGGLTLSPTLGLDQAGVQVMGRF